MPRTSHVFGAKVRRLFEGVRNEFDGSARSGAPEQASVLQHTGNAAGVVICSRRAGFSRIAAWIPGATPGIAVRVVMGSDDQQRTGRRAESGNDVPTGPLVRRRLALSPRRPP